MMNCKICGAPIAEGQEFCEECLKRHTPVAVESAGSGITEEGKAALRRKVKVSGIVALVCAIVGVLLASIGVSLSMLAVTTLDPELAEIPAVLADGFATVGAVMSAVSAVLCTVGVVFGILAIVAFRRAKKEGVKAVGGLVMGIIGLAESGSGLLAALMGVLYTVAYYALAAL